MVKRQIIIVLVALFSVCLKAQKSESALPFNSKSDLLFEKIEVFTDRGIYIASEKIHFKLDYSTNKSLNNYKWSSAVYIELIKPDGTPVQQSKFKMENDDLSGSITIPGNIQSGNYYLKAYTKWMRNFSTTNYGYALLKVVNPKSSLFETDDSITTGSNLKLEKLTQEDQSLKILTDKARYSKREKVNVALSKEGFSEEEVNYTISVIRKGTEQAGVLKTEGKPEIPTEKKYLPELYGLTISGRIKNPSNMDSTEDVTLNMSLINNWVYFSAYETKENGPFYFNIPESFHALDCYLMVNSDKEHLDIVFDSEYCQEEVDLPTPGFKMDSNMLELAKELSVNAQLSNLFDENKKDNISNKMEESPQVTFYGTPHYEFYTKDYIDLPYISEFIFEIIPQVVVTNRKNQVTIRSKKTNSLSYCPYLVLMDNIIVTDLNKLLKKRTNQIEKIELIERGYAIGNMKYGGVIHLKTKQKDFAGMDLPDNSVFISFDTYSKNTRKETRIMEEHIPDRRNILYWNPEFKFQSGIENKFSFQTTDVAGEYIILIKTVSEHTGEVEYAIKEFTIE